MSKRIKNKFPPALRAKDFKLGEIPFAVGKIIAVKDITTKNFGSKTVMNVKTEKDDVGIFLNKISIDNLIEAFGDEDEYWIGKKITTKVEEDKKFSKIMIVVYPLKD